MAYALISIYSRRYRGMSNLVRYYISIADKKTLVVKIEKDKPVG